MRELWTDCDGLCYTRNLIRRILMRFRQVRYLPSRENAQPVTGIPYWLLTDGGMDFGILRDASCSTRCWRLMNNRCVVKKLHCILAHHRSAGPRKREPLPIEMP